MKKVIVSAMLGNGLEWYDFALYGYFASIISVHFFPSSDPYISLLATYGAFAAGFLMRPVGAVFFGIIGDRYGRKISLTIAILTMAIPTACIGLLPTYAQIGILAPILLTIIRLFQGFSLGGEFSGSITFMVEHSSKQNRGLIGTASIVSLILGMVMGSLTATVFSEILSKEDLESWGWRIPFLFGIVIGLVGFYIRSHTDESPQYEKAKKGGSLSKKPIRDVFSMHKKESLIAIGIYLSVTVPFYIFSVFMITFYSKILARPLNEALLINLSGMLVLIFATVFSGFLSDKIGRKKILLIASVLYLIFALPIFNLIVDGAFLESLVANIIFAIILGFYIGPVPAILVELFPTKVRYSGMAVSYNICAAIFGGTAPMVATWLIKETKAPSVVAFYIILCAIISIISLIFFKDKFKEKLH